MPSESLVLKDMLFNLPKKRKPGICKVHAFGSPIAVPSIPLSLLSDSIWVVIFALEEHCSHAR